MRNVKAVRVRRIVWRRLLLGGKALWSLSVRARKPVPPHSNETREIEFQTYDGGEF
jgi:hypothetical protein